VTKAYPREADVEPAIRFAARVAPLFEGAPRFLARLAAARPFGSWDQLFASARSIAHGMPVDEQVELIDAHPRLGAPRGSVSAQSFREQGYDRATGDAEPGDAPADPAAAGLDATLRRLNDAYEARFGFRYCVYVAGRPLAALVPDFEAALDAQRDAERRRALDAVVDIARARLEAAR
jgi:2-oxo-4-hydroxy-4-carboxy--5-ureidoimidazoline (OHCU) decarboxylase